LVPLMNFISKYSEIQWDMQIFRKIFIVKKVNLKMEVFRQFDVSGNLKKIRRINEIFYTSRRNI
jgi:hypothetical protein